jgi:hypothetical protein
MLLCSLFFACGAVVGQNSSPGDPCTYGLPHYEEDWSCVQNESHRADPSDAIKHVVLGKDGDSIFHSVEKSGRRMIDFAIRILDRNPRILMATCCNGIWSMRTFT